MLNGGRLDGVQILAPKTVNLMRFNHLPDAIDKMEIAEGNPILGCGFGLGFCVIQDVAKNGTPGSTGNYYWGGAASTGFWIDPVEDMYAILMTQFMPSGHYPLSADFKTLVYQALVD